GLVVLRDRPAGRGDALGVGVPLRGGKVLDHVAEDLVWRLEAEGRGIADVQLDDLVALGLHAGGLGGHRASDLVAHVAQLRGLGADHRGSWPGRDWASGYRRGGRSRTGAPSCRQVREGLPLTPDGCRWRDRSAGPAARRSAAPPSTPRRTPP